MVDQDDGVVGHPVGGTALDPPVDLHGAGLDEVVGDRPATARLGRHPTVEALVGRGHQPPSAVSSTRTGSSASTSTCVISVSR